MAFQRVEQLKNKYKMIVNVICKILIPQHLRSAPANEFSESGKVFIRAQSHFNGKRSEFFVIKLNRSLNSLMLPGGRLCRYKDEALFMNFSPTSTM